MNGQLHGGAPTVNPSVKTNKINDATHGRRLTSLQGILVGGLQMALTFLKGRRVSDLENYAAALCRKLTNPVMSDVISNVLAVNVTMHCVYSWYCTFHTTKHLI